MSHQAQDNTQRRADVDHVTGLDRADWIPTAYAVRMLHVETVKAWYPLTRPSRHQSLPPRTLESLDSDLPVAADLPEADYLCVRLAQSGPAYVGAKMSQLPLSK